MTVYGNIPSCVCLSKSLEPEPASVSPSSDSTVKPPLKNNDISKPNSGDLLLAWRMK